MSTAVENSRTPSGHGSAPSVSVVVATRDRPELLRRSVQAILDQDYAGPIRCIVVFDQSEPTHIPVDLAPGRDLTLMRNTRTPGLAGARNTGSLAAEGELLAYCDDDDVWLPGKIALQVSLLQATPEAAVVACGIHVRYENHTHLRLPPRAPVTHRDLLRSRVMEVNPCTVLFRRQLVLGTAGLVDEALPGGFGEDYDWLLRVSKIAPIPSVPEPLVDIYWHRASFFKTRWQTVIDALEFLLAKHPELGTERVGFARIAGQLAFAHAGLGDRREAWQWAGRALRHNPVDRRALAAVLVASGLLQPSHVLRLAHRMGRGL